MDTTTCFITTKKKTRPACLVTSLVKQKAKEGLPAAGVCIALGNLIPIDDIPPGAEVLRAAVLILEVVGMLPYIVAQNREVAICERAVLVGSGGNFKLAMLVEDEPGPPRTEAV